MRWTELLTLPGEVGVYHRRLLEGDGNPRGYVEGLDDTWTGRAMSGRVIARGTMSECMDAVDREPHELPEAE